MKTGITFLIVGTITGLFPLITSIPWWSFLIPLFLVGVVLPFQRWKVRAFLTSFLAGFCVWLGTTLYFEKIYDGDVMKMMSGIADLNSLLMYLIIGSIGGVLSGLAVYSGFLLKRGREVLSLEITANNNVE